jgi:glycosyltransferase involved in cell wall biosynthesis
MVAAPRVSVVMAAYNAADHIGKAIASLEQQTLHEWELVVVDDCSCDNTREIVLSFQQSDARIICQRTPENKGPAAARNLGFALARGEWITILDSDDRYEPDRLRALLEQATFRQADLVADNLGLYDETAGKVICRAYFFSGDSLPLTTRRLVDNDGPPRLAGLGHLKPFIRRSFWRESGVSYPEEIRLGEDFCFLFLLLEKTKSAVLLNDVGYLYTLPYSVLSGQAAVGSRTDYGFDGLDSLKKANDLVVDHIARTASDDTVLIDALREHGERLKREKEWRKIKQHVKKLELLHAATLAARSELSFLLSQLLIIAKRKLGSYQTIVR